MSPAILFGLVAAVCYGTANVIARFSGRSVGVLPTLVWSQLFLLLCASIAVLLLCARFEGDLIDWAALLAANLSIIAATACLYRGLATGRLSVVAPVMASYGAVGSGLSLLTGEEATPVLLTGLSLTVVGAILSALPSKTRTNSKTSGVWLAAGAAVFYGLGYWLQGKFVLPAFGPVPTIWLYYLNSAAVFGLTAMLRRTPVLHFGGAKDVALLLITASLSGGGFAAMMVAQADGEIAIATALSSAATAITVVLAFLFMKDKPDWKGWLGVAAVVAGIAILQLAAG
ncbi:DMT family transporter [Asticcacaulis sp. YBE204]|uniref:DMT family transporter n=1 Tax=Asticcacaulis sp. YBE204 TaxID=1282363 RepID=UPI0003C41070|nr:DMT family transporter [Asticcacaulis sp. YBE204]ESQ79370.1 hypothetical protein AEYBE204_10195 [Asticcacaulis sp. YBE204]